MKRRAAAALGVLLAAGVFMAFSKVDEGDSIDEQWMVDNSPRQVEGFKMLAGEENPDYSYKMAKVAYDTLEPYGIVAKVYVNEKTGESYDVVLIASKSKDSFHDPRVCFSVQGWALNTQWVDSVETETRGLAYMTITDMDGPTGRGKLAAFLYRGQGKFYKSTNELKIGMFIEQLKGGGNLDGVFYRIIPQHNNPDSDALLSDLKNFIAAYLDAANEASNGYF
ncbi:MAG: exosortase-associated EpsI family protein [Armatimonadetes bacterium]|nr:exosortase-associated EpsI family protein [Armatimonadota bacterium]